MKSKRLTGLGMTICVAGFAIAAGRMCLGGGLADLPDLTRPTPRLPAERLVPPKTDTAPVTETRHAAMLDATRGTKEGLVGGRHSALEIESLTNPQDAEKRLEPPKRPELVLEPLPTFPKPELTLETLTDDCEAL